MKKLLFVYNANSGKLNSLMDSLQKSIYPSTYSCKLCELSFGIFGEKKSWKRFRENLSFETEFLHKDEFHKQYASKFRYKFEFPLILFQTCNELEMFMSEKEISKTRSLEELIEKIEKRLNIF